MARQRMQFNIPMTEENEFERFDKLFRAVIAVPKSAITDETDKPKKAVKKRAKKRPA